ncbi:hypothetical protein [Floridanema aerugineum]|uniref:Uncharacterized protein n=1 Tax=Floridaenema aerugineum BLCC-F46 TaxID=3153654 RepID=A0ABV4X014_9CYAN
MMIDNLIDLDKQQKKLIRQQMFLHLDGLGLGTTLSALNERNVLQKFHLGSPLSLEELSQEVDANPGYLNVALHLLACQGWMICQTKEAQVTYSLTEEGKLATELSYIYGKPMRWLQMATEIESCVFGEASYRASLLINEFEKLVNDARCNWELPNPKTIGSESLYSLVFHHLNGMLIAPCIVALSMAGAFDQFNQYDNRVHLGTLPGNQQWIQSVLQLLEMQEWLQRSKCEEVQLTLKGAYAVSRAHVYGVAVSYLPTFVSLHKLLYGDWHKLRQRSSSGQETHINRYINLWGSRKAHQTYFRKLRDIVIEIFNQPNPPLGIADMGCGDGALIEYLYQAIKNSTERGKTLNDQPLWVVCADYNEIARQAAHARLTAAEIPHIVLFGDINDPDGFAKKLWNDWGINLLDLLNVRSFIDHNRPYIPPKCKSSINKVSTTGAFVYEGQLLNEQQLYFNLKEHFCRWFPYIGHFGLLVLELHTLNPTTVSSRIGDTLDISTSATHGYSDQYPIELNKFILAAAEAGLKSDLYYQCIYPSSEVPSVSINLFKPSL